MADQDTIFALSSGRPPAAIGVIRISGPRARNALVDLVGRVPEPRRAALRKVRDPKTEKIIDEALVLWLPGPNSETGEDTAELQLHGSRAVVAAVATALGRLPGFRPAEAGEFTRRAFENGRLDLTEVEGLADLIAAETEAQRRQAFHQLKGLLGARAEVWREMIVEASAFIEASIDFADEGDVPLDLVGPALEKIRPLSAEITALLALGNRGERLREGMVVAIAGPPNAGKSSIINRISRREAAIVSPWAGTTRDIIEVHLDLNGYPVTLLDTAGIRDTDDPVEAEGVRRARQRAAEADLVLWVVDATEALADGEPKQTTLSWIIRNKADLLKTDSAAQRLVGAGALPQFLVSAVTGAGMDGLIAALADHAGSLFGSAEPAVITRERHRQALEETSRALQRALSLGTRGAEEVVAEELRLASRALGRLVGKVDVEDILDVIFRDFCIGK